jgi:hypothetical protein
MGCSWEQPAVEQYQPHNVVWRAQRRRERQAALESIGKETAAGSASDNH